jgi:hypothetical protein
MKILIRCLATAFSVAGGSSEPSNEASSQTFAPGQIRISAVVSVQFETLSGTGK